MKKLFLCLLSFFILASISFSQDSEGVSQVILPIDVYVGDHAEIRYTFRSAIDFFPGETGVEHKDLENPFVGLEENFSVVKAELYRNDMEYTVRFVIVPWKVGTISFPGFNLNKALGIKPEENTLTEEADAEPEFIVALYPVQIKSIVEKTDNRQMMPPVPPIIIPGTTYVIFLLILAAIIVLILFFRILLKFNSIRKKWLLYLQKRAYKKNADDAVKKIKRLLKTSKVTDIEFCSSMQAITRQYLDFRFDFRFSAISSSSIPAVFEKICAGQIPSEISEAVDNITSMFIRTDYIRYAHDSIDSQLYPPQEHQAALIKNERRQLVQMILNAIEAFESDANTMETEGEVVS
ncbi:MAG: hypothetical protein SPJ44_00790 [Treponema sp.]|nr:hypothetical protein [uncultured Treponema sp.]MDY5884837.1 hypothetical protein [Treponema sp.]